MIEKIPTPENIDLLIEQLLEKLAEYGDLYDEVTPELRDQWYLADMQATVGKDREAAKAKLEEFLEIIEVEKQKKIE